MNQKQMLEIINGYIKAYNDLDVEGMLSFLHEDITFHNVTEGRYGLSVNGREEFGTLATQALSLFESRQQTIAQTVFDGETATAKIDYVGTLTADLPPFGTAGETIKFRGRSEFVFKDGLIHILTDYS